MSKVSRGTMNGLRGKIFSMFLVVLALMISTSPLYAKNKVVLSPSGLKYEDLHIGKGAKAVSSKQILIQYTGWFDINGKKGDKFDSSYDKGRPLPFVLGVGRAIKGLDEGIQGMRVGGKRLIMIPADLAYGSKGMSENRKQIIPPDSPVMFEVELLEVK